MAVAERRSSSQPVGADLILTVAPSAAVELYWAAMTGPDGQIRVSHPSLAVIAADAALLGRIARFWGASGDGEPASAEPGVSVAGFPELLVLADRAGVIASTDLATVVSAAAASAASVPGELALASETAIDRAVIVARLSALASSRPRRRAWEELLGEVAARIREHWEQTGLDVSRRAARARASQLPWAEPAGAVLRWARGDYGGVLRFLLLDAAATGRPVSVVPSYWSGRGALFDLPGRLLVGIPAQLGASDSRARTEPLVPVLKAMADPTRLAMLDSLVERPRTVGELADDFGLAQPTASRHVRLLRNAGLVVDTSGAATNLVSADADAIAGFVTAVDRALSAAGRPPTTSDHRRRS